MGRLDLETFKQRASKKRLDVNDYEYYETYSENNRTKIRGKHIPCGRKIDCLVSNHFRKTMCVCHKSLSTPEFISEARKVHGDKYNYDKTNYINTTTDIEIFCNICKVEFWQFPASHLNRHGHQKCSNDILTEEDVQNRLNNSYGL